MYTQGLSPLLVRAFSFAQSLSDVGFVGLWIVRARRRAARAAAGRPETHAHAPARAARALCTASARRRASSASHLAIAASAFCGLRSERAESVGDQLSAAETSPLC